MGISPDIVAQVAGLLGRQPRGLEAIAVAREDGQAMVIRVASLVEDKPFPTLFWLVDPQLNYRIDQEEAAGRIAEFQAVIDRNGRLQSDMLQDHRAHIALRDSYITPALRAALAQRGFDGVLDKKGIGGIADFTRIRCLHTWYAAHLVVPNTVGRLLDDYWQQQGDN